MLAVDSVQLRRVRMELRQPFQTSFGTTQERRIVLVSVRDGDRAGYGEVTAAEGPFFSYETFQTAWHLLADFIIPQALGHRFESAAGFPASVRRLRGHPMAKAAFENALWDLESQKKGQPLWRLLGGRRDRIACGVSIGIQSSIDVLLEKIAAELDSGYRRIKIKIQPGWDVDVVRAVREAFPRVSLMVDANAAYTLDDVSVFRELDRFDLMMVEQPLDWSDILDHATLQKQIRTPICLDESIRSADDARRAIQIGACRIVNIKLGRVGGHTSARAIHDVCRDRGVPVWCGGMLESGIGRAHNVALSSLENFSLPGDVSASRRYWMEDLIVPEVEVTREGEILQSEEAGLGYAIRQDRIDRLTEAERTFTR